MNDIESHTALEQVDDYIYLRLLHLVLRERLHQRGCGVWIACNNIHTIWSSHPKNKLKIFRDTAVANCIDL